MYSARRVIFLIGLFALLTSSLGVSAKKHRKRWYKKQAKAALGDCVRDARERGFRISKEVTTISSCFAGGFITEVAFYKSLKCKRAPCPLAPVQLIGLVEFGCDDEITYAECSWRQCSNDEDCADTDWCRNTEYGSQECVPFVGAGESCEGYTTAWSYERCAPDLQCVGNPMIPDLPGVCATCDDNGAAYMAGESFLSSDGCNTCVCQEGGLMACTRMACIPECVTAGCSGQLCVPVEEEGTVTTCEWRAEYGCLQHSSCGANGPGGSCAWEETVQYEQCLADITTR